MIRKFFLTTAALMGLAFSLLAPHSRGSTLSEKCLNVQLKTVDGEVYKFSQLKGKPTVLVFWASWCPHCRREMPRLKELKEQEGSAIQIIAVSMDRDMEGLKNYLRQLEPNFTIYTRNEELPECFGGIRGVPTLFVLNKEFNIIKKFEGTTPNEEIKEALLKGKACGCL